MMQRWIRVTSFLALLLVVPWPAHAIQWGAGTGTSYPTTLDTANNRTNVGGGSCSSATTTNICKEWLNDWQSAVIAIMTELGTLPKGTSASLKERLAGIRSFAGATADTLVVSGLNVGIRTTGPANGLHIKAQPSGDNPQLYLQQYNDDRGWKFGAYADGNLHIFSSYTTTDTERITVDYNNGNVGIGTTGPPAGGGPALAFGQGANPTGIGANTAGLYAKDVAGTAELFTFDEAGNFTQISAADGTILNRRPPRMIWMPWAFSKTNIYTGEVWEVDMGEVIAAVEQLTGKTFATHTHGPRQDWEADQQAQVDAKQQTIDAAMIAKAQAMTDADTEEDEIIKKEKLAAADAMTIPAPHIKKAIPQWIQRRIEGATPKGPMPGASQKDVRRHKRK